MNWRQLTIGVFLALGLLLGGASAAGLESNMLLQLLALPLLAAALLKRPEVAMSAPVRQLSALLILAVALIGVQLIPLPPELWASLPGRQSIAEGYAALGLSLPWLPLSLAPYRTIASALWLLPAIAMMTAMIRLRPARLTGLVWTILAITMASVALGAMQAAGGEGSPWYLYEITNFGVGTGFFANANHLATLLVATIPFLAALQVQATTRRNRRRASTMTAILIGALLVVFVGLAVNRSIAGIGLAVPALAASALIVIRKRNRLSRSLLPAVTLLTIGSIVVAFTAPFGNNLTSAEARSSEESRYTSFTRTLEAAGDFAPLGSGIGTFNEIYRTYEDPDRVTRFFMNHTHSDYIELALEGGIPALLLVLIFLAWWVRRTTTIWRLEEQAPFAEAATIASAVMLAHSVVDYPLRTAALSVLFAFCCAIMAEPRTRIARSQHGAAGGDARHLVAD